MRTVLMCLTLCIFASCTNAFVKETEEQKLKRLHEQSTNVEEREQLESRIHALQAI